MRCVAALFVLVLVGCDDGTAGVAATDLSGSAEDLAVRDLGVALDLGPFDLAMCAVRYPADGFSEPIDAGGFCSGTSLAGTCAQSFFARVAECFAPMGCCNLEVHGLPVAYYAVTWANGAYVRYQPSSSEVWTEGCNVCGRLEISALGQNIDRWTLADGTTLAFATDTGDVTCPDGSHANIGPGYRQCQDMVDRLENINGTHSPKFGSMTCADSPSPPPTCS